MKRKQVHCTRVFSAESLVFLPFNLHFCVIKNNSTRHCYLIPFITIYFYDHSIVPDFFSPLVWSIRKKQYANATMYGAFDGGRVTD